MPCILPSQYVYKDQSLLGWLELHVVHVWQCSTSTTLVVASCSCLLQCSGMFLPSAVVLPHTSALV